VSGCIVAFPPVSRQDLRVIRQATINPRNHVADLKSGIFNVDRHSVLRASACERQQMSARLQYPQTLAPNIHARDIVVPFLSHEGQAVGRIGDNRVNAVVSHAAKNSQAVPAVNSRHTAVLRNQLTSLMLRHPNPFLMAK
jgi:hypothetical protein